MSVNTDIEKLRLQLGDTDVSDSGANAIFKDSELSYFLSAESSNMDKATLRGAEAAAAKFSRMYDFQTDGQKFERSQMREAYLALAKQLRDRGVTLTTDPAGVSSVAVTKIDGYSTDITNEEVSVGGTVNPRGRYYGRRFYDDLP